MKIDSPPDEVARTQQVADAIKARNQARKDRMAADPAFASEPGALVEVGRRLEEFAQSYAAAVKPNLRMREDGGEQRPSGEQAVEKLQAAAAALDSRRAVEQTEKALKAEVRDDRNRDQRVVESKRER